MKRLTTRLKFNALLLIISLLFSTSIYSQRAIAESVSSLYLSVPSYNVDTTNLNDLNYLFAMGNTVYKSPKVIEAEEICVASGSKSGIKKAKKIKVYQYQIPAEIQDAFLVIQNQNGETIYAEKMNSFKKTGSLVNEVIDLIYGDDKCYWSPQVLQLGWEEGKDAWKKEQHDKLNARVFKNAESIAQNVFKFGYVSHNVNVYTGKGGKDYDYSELNEAQSQAINVYKKISDEGQINQQSIDQLMVPVTTWLKYIEEYKNGEGRVNTRLARGIYLNLITAYFQIRDFEKAMSYLELHSDTYSNPTLKGTNQAIIDLSRLINDQQKGLVANPDLSNEFSLLNEKINSTNDVEIKVQDLGHGMLDDLDSSHYFYSEDTKKQTSIIASGGSIYKSNIRQGQFGPTLTMMTIYDGDLDEFPLEVTQLDVKGMVFTGGYSFESLPPEIGNMTNLVQINLTDSKVSIIPEEIGNLTNLKRLNLSRTNITTLPESIKNLKNLKMLNLKKTKISASELEKIKSLLPKGCKVKF